MWVDASAKMPTWQRRHSRRACLPDQARGASEGGAAGTPWRLRRSCHLAQLASRFVSRLPPQQCTQMPQNGPEEPFQPICVHRCVPTVARATLTSQQCTQIAKNCAERPFSPTCVHSYVPTSVHNGATVYTSAPKRRREPIFADLCTLLHTHGRSRDRAGLRVPRHRRPHGPRATQVFGPEARPTGAMTQPPTRAHEAS